MSWGTSSAQKTTNHLELHCVLQDLKKKQQQYDGKKKKYGCDTLKGGGG